MRKAATTTNSCNNNNSSAHQSTWGLTLALSPAAEATASTCCWSCCCPLANVNGRSQRRHRLFVFLTCLSLSLPALLSFALSLLIVSPKTRRRRQWNAFSTTPTINSYSNIYLSILTLETILFLIYCFGFCFCCSFIHD